MLEGFSSLVLNLYRGCQTVPAPEFQNWALEQIKTIFPFYSAVWLTGWVRNCEYAVHTLHYYNQPRRILEDFDRVDPKERHVLNGRAFQNPGITFRCVAADEFSPALLAHCRRFHVEHLMPTWSVEPISGLGEMISLHRSDAERPFTEDEGRFQQSLVPHLAETWRICRMKKMLSDMPFPNGSNSGAAAVDVKHVLHLVDPGFIQLMQQEWPDWRGPHVPAELAASLARGEAHFVGNTLVIGSLPLNDLTILRVRSKAKVDSLSRREREVAKLFAAGQTNKEIAKSLLLSPATVRNHLTAAYTKLGVNNKVALLEMLREFG